MPLLDDFPINENGDAIRMMDGREAMGNDQDGPANHQALNRRLDKPLRFIVE